MKSRTFWLGVLISASCVLSGCDGPSVRSDTLKRFPLGSRQADMGAAIGGDAIYTLDYLVDGHVYRYQTVRSGDLGRYFGLLFKDGVLVSMHAIEEDAAYWSKLRDCELFPFPKGFDSVACMRGYSDQFTTLGASYPAELDMPDEAAKSKYRSETAGTVVETAVVMAFTFPVSIVVIPAAVIVAGSASGAKAQSQQVNIRLGEKYDDIRSAVEALPDKMRDVEQGDGSFYVPRGDRANGSPIAAFGVQDGIVVWMEQYPRSVCTSSLSSVGAVCWLANDTTDKPGYFFPKGQPGGVDALKH